MQKYIRLTTDTEFNEEQLDELYEIVEETTNIILTTAIDDDGETIGEDVAISMYNEDEHICYEIIVSDETDSKDFESIVLELEELILQDFEIELVRE